MRTTIIIIGLVLCFISYKSAGQGNLVLNGGFDASADHVHADDWSTTSDAFFNGKYGNPAPEMVLDVVSATDTETAGQTINNLTPGLLYIVSGDYDAGDMGATAPPGISFAVLLDSSIIFQTTTPTDSQWHSFSASVVATSTSEVLQLTAGLNGTGIGYHIDNIAMEVVPEPSTSLLSLLFIGFVVWDRQFKKTSNNHMHRTATSRCSLVSVGWFGSWICSRSPFPVAVGGLGR